MRMFDPPHPGLVIQDMMESRSVSEVAEALGVDQSTLSGVITGHTSISPDLAGRLSKVFGLYAKTWLEMQANFDARQIDHDVVRSGVKSPNAF